MLLPIRPAHPRRGLSLLEVLVALAIFLLSFVAIGRLVTLAGDQALEVQYQSQAARLAQSKLNEVIAGVVPLQGAASGTFDEDEDWHWSIDTEQNGNIANLWTVTVTVNRPSAEGNGHLVVAVVDGLRSHAARQYLRPAERHRGGRYGPGDQQPESEFVHSGRRCDRRGQRDGRGSQQAGDGRHEGRRRHDRRQEHRGRQDDGWNDRRQDDEWNDRRQDDGWNDRRQDHGWNDRRQDQRRYDRG